MTPGQLLRAARESAGLSQLEVDRRAGLNRGMTCNYEADRRTPSVEKAAQLCAAIGCDMSIFNPLMGSLPA